MMNGSMSTRINGFSLPKEDLEHIAEHVARDSGRLAGARLLITGGTGFFGIWLLEGLLYASRTRGLGLRISVLSRNPDAFLTGGGRHLAGYPELDWIRGSLLDFDMGAGPFSHILHAASESNPDGAPDWALRHMRTAVLGMQRLIDMAAAQKTEALLITTSGAVYGQFERIVDQRFAEGPGSAADYASEKHVYGQSKRMMETMLAVTAAEAGYRALIARCFAFFGPYLNLDSNYAIGNFMRDALAGKPIVVSGDGTPLRSYLYAADLVIWLVAILARGVNGRPYNVGGETACSIGELAQLVNRCAGGRSEVVVMQKAPPGVAPSAYLPDVGRARSELGLQEWINLETGLSRTLDWHRARGSS
jgi:nucleoside-diphosphate-sugar epimerase